MWDKRFTFLSKMSTPGQIVLLFLAGWKGIHDSLRCMLGIVFHASLNSSHPANGITWTEPKIQLIVPPGAYSPLSCLDMSYGGAVWNSCGLHLPNGPNKCLFLQVKVRRKREKSVYSPPLFPDHHFCQSIAIPSFTKLKCVTAWALWFVNNCRLLLVYFWLIIFANF